MPTLSIIRPDDWHVHLRDGAVLTDTVADASRHFARAIVMPNLAPPVTDTAQARAYRQRLMDALPPGRDWQALMSLYLTDDTTSAEIQRAADSGFIHGVKLYPAGATTNSASGVTDIRHCDDALEKMQELGLPLQIHGEVTDSDIDIFDREAVFIERTLEPLRQRFPALKIIFEHLTTRQGVEFVRSSGPEVAATITPQHLLYNRNDMLVGGVRPHFYCLPVLKRASHQMALIEAATSGDPSFFLGTDSAPHARNKKESACGCAGCYSHHAAIELYAEAFERADALDKLEGFASLFGPRFYGLPVNKTRLTLQREAWQSPEVCQLGGQELIPLGAGQTLQWRVLESDSENS